MKLTSTTSKLPVAIVFILCAFVLTIAQEKPQPSPGPSPAPRQLMNEKPAAPAANPADVASMDAIIAAVYDVISGPAERNGTGTACVRCLFPARA